LIAVNSPKSRRLRPIIKPENQTIKSSDRSHHLMKVVNWLSTCGCIETVRDKGGGMRLARAPKLINVGDVVRNAEERFDIVECFNEKHQDCPLLPACILKSVLNEARGNFLATLDRHTLQAVLGGDMRGMFSRAKGKRIPIRRAE
jgi:Rrf2 family nitric oxide-sensitive transcriptional repressor